MIDLIREKGYKKVIRSNRKSRHEFTVVSLFERDWKGLIKFKTYTYKGSVRGD